MPRIGKCECGGELTIGSYSNKETGVATAFCRKCFKEYRLEMKGESRFYRRIKEAKNET